MSWIENIRKWWKRSITYYPPLTDEQREAHERVNEIIEDAGNELIDICPASEQLENALIKVTEARMWAHAALAIHSNNPDAENLEK